MDDLCEKIKRSEVKVDIEIQNSDLPNLLNKMRNQYQKIAEKNQKEMDDWYQSKVRGCCFLCFLLMCHCISTVSSAS